MYSTFDKSSYIQWREICVDIGNFFFFFAERPTKNNISFA